MRSDGTKKINKKCLAYASQIDAVRSSGYEERQSETVGMMVVEC